MDENPYAPPKTETEQPLRDMPAAVRIFLAAVPVLAIGCVLWLILVLADLLLDWLATQS